MPATGKVIGRLVTLIVDKDDPDQEPDLVPLAGKVIFQLNTARVTELNADPVPMVIASTPLEAVLDASGYLSTPDIAGGVQYQGIRLLANDDPDLNPTDTQYTVSYSLTVQGTNTQVAIPSHLLFLPSGATVDLATMIPPVAAPAMSIAQAEALLALAVRSVNGVEPDPDGNVVVAGGGGAVDSVNGQTGIVVLNASDVGAATSTQGAKADTAVQPADLTKAAVGLPNVDNTSDANKPVSTATQGALDTKASITLVNTKAPIANPTFTGTVGGITKAMVGLGSVDNTSDANKPVSGPQQTALDAKVPTSRTVAGYALTADVPRAGLNTRGVGEILFIASGAAVPGTTPVYTLIVEA